MRCLAFPVQMRFIFSLVANITYTLFCCSIQFIILYLYRITCFPSLYMLSSSLVVFTLYNSAIVYALCIGLLFLFHVDTFRSQNDIPSASADVTASPVVPTDNDSALLNSMSEPQLVAQTVPVYHEVHVNALISILLCHFTAFAAVVAVYIVALCECIYVAKSALCGMTLGNHSANNAIGIALIVLSASIILPMLGLYKLNAGTSTVFHKHMPTLVVFFICLMHIAILSKFVFYSVSCPLVVSFSGSLVLVYFTIFLHFAVCLCDYLICSVLSTSHSPHFITEETTTYSNLASLICNTVLMLGNLAYAWQISVFFNFLQCAVIVIFIISMACRTTPTRIINDYKKDR